MLLFKSLLENWSLPCITVRVAIYGRLHLHNTILTMVKDCSNEVQLINYTHVLQNVMPTKVVDPVQAYMHRSVLCVAKIHAHPKATILYAL